MDRANLPIGLLSLVTVIVLAGCGGGQMQDSEQSPPNTESVWVEISPTAGSGSGRMGTEDGKIKVFTQNRTFKRFIMAVCDAFQINITVRPAALLDRGITIEVVGKDAQEIMAEISRQCGLELGGSDSLSFILFQANASDSDEYTVRPDDE